MVFAPGQQNLGVLLVRHHRIDIKVLMLARI
jgi:hypothetical protein